MRTANHTRPYNGKRDKKREDDIQTRALSLRADTVNEEARTVEAILSTENPVTVVDYRRGMLIDEVLLARAAEFPDQVVMLNSHQRYDLSTVLGSVRGIHNEGGTVTGTLHFMDHPDVERAWQLTRQKHVTDVSVGYRVLAYTDIEPNQRAVVAGREFKAGDNRMRIVTRWKLRELSLVPIGADDAAKIRELQHGPDPAFANKEKRPMNKHLRKYLESLGLRADATEADAQAYFESLEGGQRSRAELIQSGSLVPPDEPEGQRAEPAPSLTTDDITKAVREAAQDAQRIERERQTAIRAEAAEYEIPADVAQRAIDGGLTVEAARAEFLKALRESRSQGVAAGVGIISHDADRATMVRALAAGLQIQLGVDVVDAKALPSVRQEQEKAAEIGNRYRNLSMLDYCREALAMRGVHARSRDDVLDALRDDLNGQRFATADISNIFTTSVNAVLMKAYMDAPDTTQGWCYEVDVPDYKTQDVIGVTGTDGLDRVGENGEAKHASMNDNIESFRVHRYAKQFGIDEIALINDSMGALQEVPAKLGQAAARIRPELVYYLLNTGVTANALADGYYVYDTTNHRNYLAGAAGALDAGALEVGITTMGKQYEVVPGNKKRPLNISPKYLIVPKDLEFTAAVLLRSVTRDHDGANGNFNPLQGLLELRADDRIGVNGCVDPATGTTQAGLATAWYLFADPNIAECIRVAYLRGRNRQPRTRSFVYSQGRWGVGWDIEHTVGAKWTDFLGTYKTNGTG